jgi:lipoprotein signal peptidase
MHSRMPSRLALVFLPALAVASADLASKALLRTHAWDYHQRSHAWSVVGFVLLGTLLLVGLVPSRFASLTAGLAAGGVAGNVISARMHGGRVPNPLVAGTVAFNLADLVVAVAAPLLTLALVRVAIRNRAFIDRHVPPRPWELALRRRLGL